MKKAGSRAANRQVIDGGRVVTVREGGWSKVADQPPLLDEVRYPKKKGKKKIPKKERCRVNPHGRTHEWMKDEERIPVIENYWTEERTFRIPVMKNRQVGTKPCLYKLCAHCGKTLYKIGGRRFKWSERSPGYYTRYKLWNGRTVIH